MFVAMSVKNINKQIKLERSNLYKNTCMAKNDFYFYFFNYYLKKNQLFF